ncbi:MAG: amino acid adenylation domain-containing protein [Pseudonocardiaceae bacterium]|nr:amino acid adenylation domain-containing protein [Pseudonocardiaceae bacterium]
MCSESSPAHLAPPADLAELVERSVEACPDAVAVTSGDASMTYAELDVAANRLAHHLLELGVAPEAPVGICVRRCLAMPVGLLAILKAGGACLPLDPSYPVERLRFMLADAQPPVVLVQPGSAELIEAARNPQARIVDLDAHHGTGPAGRPERQRVPEALAYLIYTSGSTGEPRGVLLPHRALVNHCLAAVDLYDVGPADRVLQFCSPSFDVSVEELFPTWAAGARVVLRPDRLAILGRPWLDWLAAEGLTVLNLPTAYWHAWVRDLETLGMQPPAGLRVVIVGGERATAAAYRSWLRAGGDRVRWFNAYGPTEASVMATIFQAPPGGEIGAGDSDPPIGRPLPGVTVHVLDSEGRPVADGETGELHIGGVGLARGYLNQPELTAEGFVADPFSRDGQGRLYRTGDMARVRPDGELEFVGRRDRQVKVSGGFRVEPGEVEVALRSHPGVTDAVVLPDQEPSGQRRLIGYVVTAPGATVLAAGLRRHLTTRLPAYLVPANFVLLSEFPMTPNGKVDHAALASPQRPRPDPRDHVVAPRTPVEKAVADIWSAVLGIGEVGTDDDLFESGGDSLRVAQIAAAVQETFGTPIPLATLLAEPTVAALARYLDAEGPRRAPDVPTLVASHRRRGTRVPLSLPQEQMWQLETATGLIANQNVTACHHFSEPVDAEALGAALRVLVERHEILRTRFSIHCDSPCQQVAADVPVELATVDLSAERDGDVDGHMDKLLARQDSERFELDRPPLFRARRYRLDTQRCVLAVTFDHLICDGPSAYIFLSELVATYHAMAAGTAVQLRPLPVQYADFADWQRRWLTEDRLADQLDYWRRALAGAPIGPALPLDRIPAEPTRRLRSLPVRIGRARYESLSELARQSQASVFMLCVAAVSALLSRLGETSDIVLSTTLSGRRRAELEGVIGTFAGTGRIRTDLSGDPSFTKAVARARDAVIGLFEHQDIPFSRVRDAVLPELSRHHGNGPPLAMLPVDLQYFRAAHDHWVPGTGVVERPGPDKGPDELYFRGQLHPLSLSLLDDGTEVWGEVVYKQDFYDEVTIERLRDGLHRLLEAVVAEPEQRLSAIPLP